MRKPKRPWLFGLFPLTVAVATGGACATDGNRGSVPLDRAAAAAAVTSVLDALHHNASVANEASYFALFAPEGVFFGTDAMERWTVDQFRAYAHPVFERGQGWTYVLREGTRNVDFDPTGTVAWFDEILDNENYGETRGTGVMRLIGGEWKIAQYHLTIPVPNELAGDLVAMIRGRNAP
ncbi:MAG TPA: nuclear transport factor 2 family protein [Gemmatimonadales bacterium]